MKELYTKGYTDETIGISITDEDILKAKKQTLLNKVKHEFFNDASIPKSDVGFILRDDIIENQIMENKKTAQKLKQLKKQLIELNVPENEIPIDDSQIKKYEKKYDKYIEKKKKQTSNS